MKTLSAYWKLPVLIFQSCDDYSGYVCTESIFGDEREFSILNANCMRRIVPLHICGVMFNYLVASEIDVETVADDSFTSILENICTFMRNASANGDNEVLQDIVDRNEQFDNLMNNSGVCSTTTSELTPEGFPREDDEDDETVDQDSGGDEDEHDDGNVADANSNITDYSSSKEHQQCFFNNDIVQDYVQRSHIIGRDENKKKLYFNTLR